ncbi:MAG: autotransporter-associated beta strand repeat-containing protein [Pirellulales bacterium]|nr:autotransporter-associated beta strand repeat-containing protein [Pirellulales bacterium]
MRFCLTQLIWPFLAVLLFGGVLPNGAWAAFATGFSTGTVQNSSIVEASGIVASRKNPNVLWTHNDSGDSARVYPISTAGANLGAYTLSGASSSDWEDIAIGPGPVTGTQYLYAGDIGDNNASRGTIAVYRVAEPTVSDTQSPTSATLTGVDKLTLAYPDGARDAESLFVDPATRDIYIISKRDAVPRLYRAVYPQATSGTTILEFMGTLPSVPYWLTAADISPDGNSIIMRTSLSNTGKIYQRPAGGSVLDTLLTAPTNVTLLSQPQGEAITFDPNGHGFYSLSENSSQPLYYYDRLGPPAGTMYWDADGVAAGSRATTGVGTGGSGTWNTSSLRWYNGSAEIKWSGADDAVFWGTAGTVTLAAGQSVNSLAFKATGYTLTGSTLTLAGGSVQVETGVTATIASQVAGTVGLAKLGEGTLVLSQANSYAAGTAINAGALLVTNTTGSATGTGPIDVASGARLGGTGTVLGAVTNSGTVSPGSSVGTLHVGGAFAQTAGGRLEIELASLASFDHLVVGGTANLGGTLAVSLVGGFVPAWGNSFEVLSSTGLADTTFSNAELPKLPGSLAWRMTYASAAVQLLVALAGDFNLNGTVDGADYVLWRTGLGTTHTLADYETWRAHFGESASGLEAGTNVVASVPEPGWGAGIVFGGLVGLWRRIRGGRRRAVGSGAEAVKKPGNTRFVREGESR